MEAERPTLAATTHEESVRQVTVQHRLSMQVTGSTRRESSQGKAPKPQSLSPKVIFSSTNYSWHTAKCIQMQKKTNKYTIFSLAPEMTYKQSTHFLTRGISLEGSLETWNPSSLSSYHKDKENGRAKGEERRQDPPGKMNKTRQTEISSEFLADVWLVPGFLGPEEQPTHWQSKWLFQKSLGGVFSPCPVTSRNS